MTETVKKSILIVDDQESIIKALRRLLMAEPYNILSAPDGESALELIKRHQNSTKEDKDNIFLIISDQRMPNMTGVEFLQAAVEMLPDAVRFILSGYSDEHSALNAIKRGIVHRYITKPWKNDELMFLINQAFNSPDKIKRLAGSNAPHEKALQEHESNIMEKELKEFEQRSKDSSLGKMAVIHGFINQKQLEESMTAMQVDRQAGRNVSLENILFEKGFISSDNMGKLVAATRRKLGKSFAAIAIKDYGVKPEDIERCFAIQAKEFSSTTTCRLLGEILVAENIITEDQKDSIVIDMTYSERDIIPNSDNNKKSAEIILNQRKKKFFKQRALDKIFCKSAIKKSFVTESEVLKALEEQLFHFTKTFEIKLIKDILLERAIIAPSQSDEINALISGDTDHQTAKQPIQTDQQSQTDKTPLQTIDENNLFELTLSDDQMEAWIKVTGDLPEDMTAEKLKKIAAENQITYGLADDLSIEIFLRACKDKSTSQHIFAIAKGKPVKLGRSASIKYFFQDHNADFGKELESGKFDYRERAEMPTVNQGAVLAEKIPLIQGVSGISVKGAEIEAPAIVDIELNCGTGAEISKDGLKVVAAANGRPDRSLVGKISVLPELAIKGDVDFKTGNIKFNGDVTVNGTILAGFTVASNNLTVMDIEEAEVNIKNNLFIKSSANDSKITTGGTVAAQILKKCTVVAQGDVVVQKEIIDCTIITSGMVKVPRGRIVASEIHAAKGIEAMNIGSDVSSPCHLFPGAEDHALDIIKQFNDKIDLKKEQLAKIEAVKEEYEKQSWNHLNNLSELSKVQEQLAINKKSILNQIRTVTIEAVKKQMAGSIADIDKKILKADEAVNKLFDEHDNTENRANETKAAIKKLQSEIEIILKEKSAFKTWYESQKEEILKDGNPAVNVQGTVSARTQITGSNASVTLKSSVRNSKIHQVMNSQNPANPFYEMRIDPLSAKTKQAHVYRNA
ncbi:MAG: flagellar assembly protein A [Desulfamplus sp.]